MWWPVIRDLKKYWKIEHFIHTIRAKEILKIPAVHVNKKHTVSVLLSDGIMIKIIMTMDKTIVIADVFLLTAKCTLFLEELSGRRFTTMYIRLWVSWQFLESSSFVQHRGWCHVRAVFLQLCVILLIYFLLQKSRTTAAAEYAVAVLAVDM